jgi:hypothetical protein
VVLHWPPLRLQQEVEHEVDAVVQQQQVLGLQIGNPLCCCQLALPDLRKPCKDSTCCPLTPTISMKPCQKIWFLSEDCFCFCYSQCTGRQSEEYAAGGGDAPL